MLKRLTLTLAALAMGIGLAAAGEGHDHAHDGAHDHGPKHNGIVVHSGHHHLELVAAGNSIELYITNEEGGAEDVAAAKASATVLAEGKTEIVTLTPAGANSLKGTGGFNAGKGTTVVVSLTLPGHETEQARFKID